MNFKVIALIGIGLIVIFGMLYWFFIRSFDSSSMSAGINMYVVDFNELDEQVYFRSKVWGISGNHTEILLSASPIDENRDYSKESDYGFYTTEVYYKKMGTDTLLVYAAFSSIMEPPKGFSSQVKIILKELRNSNELNDYERNYKDYGLSRISVYSE